LKKCFTLPLHCELTDADVELVISEIRNFFEENADAAGHGRASKIFTKDPSGSVNGFSFRS